MEWLNYHHLYYFWTVCKEGGFSKAADKLRIAQSAVSFQIVKLEEFFGEKLMDRGSRGFTLTEAGQVTLAQAEEIFRQGHDLIQYFRSGKMKASFRVGVLGGISKNLQLKILNSVVEDESVELILEVGDTGVLLEKLIHYQLEVVVSDVPFPSSEADPLVQMEIAIEPLCLVTRQRPHRKKGRSMDLRESLKEGVYFPSKSSPMTSALFEQLMLYASPLPIRGFIDDIAFLRLLALETNALVAIPRIGVHRDLQSQALHIVHEFRKIRQSYFLVYRQKGKRHPLLNRLIRGETKG